MIKFNYSKLALIYQFIIIFFLGAWYKNSIQFKIFLISIDTIISLFYLYKNNLSRSDLKKVYILITTVLVSLFLPSFMNRVSFILLILQKLYIFNHIINDIKFEYLLSVFLQFIVLLTFCMGLEFISLGQFNPFKTFYAPRVLLDMSFKVGTPLYFLRSSLEHPLITSIILVVTGPFLFLLEKKWLRYVCVFLNISLIFFIQKRTAYILVSIGVVCFALYYLKYINRRFQLNKITSVIFLMTLFIIALSFIRVQGDYVLNIIFSKFSALQDADSFSLNNRVINAKTGLDVIFDQNVINIFIGNGYDFLPNFFEQYNVYVIRNGFYVIDNTYISFLADYGMIGLFLVLLYIINAIRKSMTNIYKIKSKKEQLFMLYSIIGIINLMVSIAFFDIYAWYTPLTLLIFLISVVTSYCKFHSNKF
ncbi:oligosaccharide repeat unit polymerase [Streptococcus pneumoniae]|uniref:Oligosaccharide repeat unit polymerase Wzy n=1 Tax=Streptococcus pneumoniae TaxID=1313 RepID=Q4JYX3_STREE|nr:O-antigen polymerase [Streptococcus pneumoniae]MBW5047744.1 oligosaccharide repeat unit polymerase [Streptococcus pneumoniae]MDG8330755.1 oligosaccharide repeat unit polymerase [Streptococcus pneumoniae]MDG9477047.1 oligosaccharide repeat unit polymerase [Streptococcus pneumoniae]CAI34498.1 oligosaccharide repeat unit polymerase Wzy [Streptococcus pneumoniae]HEU7778965.1 oligosaccharide repeat unit polymerase [Streptococcus pneumoniae]